VTSPLELEQPLLDRPSRSSQGGGNKGGRFIKLYARFRTLLKTPLARVALLIFGILLVSRSVRDLDDFEMSYEEEERGCKKRFRRPTFAYEHPFVTSSYYTSSCNETILSMLEKKEEEKKKQYQPDARRARKQMAVVRPICEFDAEAMPSTFRVWDHFPPCDVDRDRDTSVDFFVCYSQTYSDNTVAIRAADEMITMFHDKTIPWTKCFDNFYAIETDIAKELDLYIPSAREELYSWVNGPNRQFEGTYRALQYNEWGEYETYYMMEGDAIPVKSFWLDTLREEIRDKTPFAILGANFELNSNKNLENHRTFDPLPRINANRTTGNYIYNLSHPLLDAFASQLEVEAPSPYNSIPFDERLVQLLEEGKTGAVPEIAPKIMLDEEGTRIEIANNTAALKKWVEEYTGPNEGWCQSNDTRYWISPYKETPELISVIPSSVVQEDLRDGSVIHAVKVYESWIKKRKERPLTLVISSRNASRTEEILASLDRKQHPFSKVKVMVDHSSTTVPNFSRHTGIPTRFQRRKEGWEYEENFDRGLMDICEADVSTEWFVVMDTDLDIRDVSEIYVATPPKCEPGAYHTYYCQRSSIRIANDLRAPGKRFRAPADVSKDWRPVVPFRHATYKHILQFPHQKKVLSRARSFLRLANKINETIASNENVKRVVYEWDAVYHSIYRDQFCYAWRQVYGECGEHLEAEPWGPTATDYYSFLGSTSLYGSYILRDSALYLHKSPFELSTQDEEVRKLKLRESKIL